MKITRSHITAFLLALFFLPTSQSTGFIVRGENSYSIYVDRDGRMRRDDTKEEVRFYGTNYTLPFAHAYRAMNRLGIDHKEAINRDVYHISRLGLNAFRLHLWDVELSDSVGNLIENDHLDLLDYLIAQFEERGISILLTAQTNFGNGYPERNIDTGAYSYDYDKCDIHANPDAIKAQQNYIKQLAGHTNPYTGKSYAEDKSIIAIEINNEPCHTTDEKQVTSYINSMVKTLKQSGWKKPILYNVSHNGQLVRGYYDASIDGTTFQWYPIGLVSGHERKGNFLPYVDSYDIPFTDLKKFGNKAKIVYEFDPADMLESYMFPAVARTFICEGFQWITQFAYDPIDMARYNTEYQTHFLNLAYTPQKALGMKIASEAVKAIPSNADFGSYPADTVFGDFMVSYKQNLALLNSPEKFIHTNSTEVTPVAPDNLQEVAGFGTSPIVNYSGLGAYMLDRIQPGLWRLEIMPDVVFTADPFAKPSLERPVAYTVYGGSQPITIKLPKLGNDFFYQCLTEENPFGGRAADATFQATPGVYLIASTKEAIENTDPASRLGNIFINEYVRPLNDREIPLHINHAATPAIAKEHDLVIRVQAFGEAMPDSLTIYPSDASFWRNDNRLYPMKKTGNYDWEVTIPATELNGKQDFSYRIVAHDTNNNTRTFPDNTEGTPLDWDAADGTFYSTRIISENEPLVLFTPGSSLQRDFYGNTVHDNGFNGAELSTIPDSWGRVNAELIKNSPLSSDALRLTIKPDEEPTNAILTKFVGNLLSENHQNLNIGTYKHINVKLGTVQGIDSLTVAVVNTDGITFSKNIAISSEQTVSIDMNSLSLSPTLLCPAPYPTFLKREFKPEGYTGELQVSGIEKIQIIIPAQKSITTTFVEIAGIWLM